MNWDFNDTFDKAMEKLSRAVHEFSERLKHDALISSGEKIKVTLGPNNEVHITGNPIIYLNGRLLRIKDRTP
jgi:hypothetical protein